MKKWLSSLGIKSETKVEDSPPPEPEIHTSPALNVLNRQLRHERKYHILDLGPACGQTSISFLSLPARSILKISTKL